jgi:hypothetical protein
MRTGSPFNAFFKGRYREEFAWFTISDSLPVATVAGRRAAAQLIEACRNGDAELLIGWPAKLAVIAKAFAPSLVAESASLTNQFVLPAAEDDGRTEKHIGWESMSDAVPRVLTKLTREAAVQNNEIV